MGPKKLLDLNGPNRDLSIQAIFTPKFGLLGATFI